MPAFAYVDNANVFHGAQRLHGSADATVRVSARGVSDLIAEVAAAYGQHVAHTLVGINTGIPQGEASAGSL